MLADFIIPTQNHNEKLFGKNLLVNYSKKFLLEIVPVVDEVVISFATRSLVKREKFKANRKWLVEFIKDNFKILDNFEINNERYICFNKT